ncbi:MAG TPA: MFS transporter [Egicoccus sp.]|nr:MFS transporter [Egicoccus sp.]HSK25080.1 MFS transporter [Egicoccus sp.]
MTAPLPAEPPPVPRTTAALLRDRTFGPWFFGNAVSNSGNWLFNVTAAIVVYRLSESALLVGLVSVAQFGPLLLLSPLGGALSDRHDRRRLLLASQTVGATAATALAVAALVVGLDRLPGAWPILLTAFGIGMGQAVAAPALQSLVPSLVDDHDLEAAVALTSLTFNLGRALGPATAGLLLATLGAEAAFVINAASFLVLIAVLGVIRPRPREHSSGRDRSVRAGLRYVRGEPGLLLLLGGVMATGFAVDPMITLAPALAIELGGSDTLAAGLVSAFGLAAVPAATISGRLQRRLGSLVVATAGCATIAAGLLLSALSPAAWVAVCGFGLTGIGFVLALTSFTSVLQRRVPDALRGRVMALWSVAFLGNRPIAALIDGAVADRAGPRWAMGVGITVAALGVLVATRLRRRPA